MLGIWCFKTNKLGRVEFYWDDITNKINPLERIPEFNYDDIYWEIDCLDQVEGYYEKSPNDSSFALIPKKDITYVWLEKPKVQPEEVSKVKFNF